MKCLNCGREAQSCLCQACHDPDTLDRVVTEILCYKEETCENEFVRAYMRQFEDPKDGRACIPELLALFSGEEAAFSRCRYDAVLRNPEFESEALVYLGSHPAWDWRRQWVVHDLLRSYARNDFVKPRKWCDELLKTDGLSAELYQDAAQYYGFVAEYDQAAEAAERMRVSGTQGRFLNLSAESFPRVYERLCTDLERYRTKKPYWPATEARRRNLAHILEEKGIPHPRITLPPKKVPEDEFQPIEEWDGGVLENYCAFWCEEVPSYTAPAKDLFQIAAVRVREGLPTEAFQSLIRPWKAMGWKKILGNLPGVDLEAVESADDVDLVMRRFFDFAQDDVLVSTQALGNQGKLISRAARYTGLKEIPNPFLDLLDYAADVSEEFDMEHNTREFLLQHFQIPEGADAEARARANVRIYTALQELEG